MKEDEKSPLMFINSVQEVNKKSHCQQIYDSRKPQKVFVQEKKEIILDEKELKKLKNVVLLYSNNIPVLCLIKCIEKEYSGIPISIDETNLVLLVEAESIIIPLSDINEFLILEI